MVILVKNGEFKKAEEMLKKHFPRPMVGKVSLPIMIILAGVNKMVTLVFKPLFVNIMAI